MNEEVKHKRFKDLLHSLQRKKIYSKQVMEGNLGKRKTSKGRVGAMSDGGKTEQRRTTEGGNKQEVRNWWK